eukprot:1540077-Amphidinium_carterae.1
MSWTPRQTELLKKQLAGLGKLLGGKPVQWNSQQPNKGQGKGTHREVAGKNRTSPMNGTASTASSTTLGTDLFASNARS